MYVDSYFVVFLKDYVEFLNQVDFEVWWKVAESSKIFNDHLVPFVSKVISRLPLESPFFMSLELFSKF